MMIIGSIPYDNKWLDRFIIIFLISAIVEVWFIIAQSAKRCHDLNKSGWYQLIPFYRLIILFLEGDVGENKYDRNPKDRHIFGSSEILDDDILLRHND